MESLENFSPVVVMALKWGAGSLSLGPASAQTAARSRKEKIAERNEMFFAAMWEMYTVGASMCQLLCWQAAPRLRLTMLAKQKYKDRNTGTGAGVQID